MNNPFYTARSSVAKVDGIHRRATLEDGTEIDFGVHGPIKSHARYTIRVPAGAPRDKVDRALATDVSKCPTACSLKGSVDVTWSADILEA